MIKKLARSIREYKRDCILTPVFVVVEVIMEVLIPFLMAKLIDEGISGGDMTVMRSTGTALIVCVLIGLLSGVLAGAFCATASAGFAKNLRQDLFDKIQTYSFANIDKFSTSSIVTRLTTDVTNVQNAFMDNLMQGRTVFVIAHRLSTVRNSDAIMVLDQGRIIERGTHDQLIEQKGVYYRLYTGAFELE